MNNRIKKLEDIGFYTLSDKRVKGEKKWKKIF